MQSVLSNCTILQFCTCAYSIWPPSHMHNPKTRTCCRTQALTSRCQGRLSASLTQYCYRVGVGFPCFSCGNLSALETTRGDAVFSNRSRRTPTQRFLILLMTCACRRIPPTGIDAECLVPPWGSLPNHTFGERRLPIPSRAGLFEWFKGIFHWKVISIRHRQCAFQFQDYFVLWCCFFPSCGNNPAVKYSCRCMDKRVLESLTASLFWPKIHF